LRGAVISKLLGRFSGYRHCHADSAWRFHRPDLAIRSAPHERNGDSSLCAQRRLPEQN
jgi:hypothetical protein